MHVRPYTDRDEQAVLGVISADRLPGQPETTSPMLAEALAGRSPIDVTYWEALDGLATEVAVTDDGEVVGVIAGAIRQDDGSGVIPWLHCREEPAVAAVLVDHALQRFGGRPVEAFAFATALNGMLEGLPVRHRPSTAATLESRGLVGEDAWCLMNMPADTPHPSALSSRVRVYGDTLVPVDDHRVCGRCVVSPVHDGTASIYWVDVIPDARGRGLGRELVSSAVSLLRSRGAKDVSLIIDDDAAAGDARDRRAARGIYERVGFQEIDRLWTFHTGS